MNIITKDTLNTITFNVSNEVVHSYFTLSVNCDIYTADIQVEPIGDLNGRAITIEYIEGVDLDFPATADYPFSIINHTRHDSTNGVVLYRGIMRLKQAAEVVYSHENSNETIIYEPGNN
jgi:hypothetical protein